VVNGKIYAIGGYRSGSHLSTVEEYDPATDTWTKKADMPAARDVVSTSVVNGKIYAIGGQSENQWPAFSTVEEYDPVTDTWTRKADMPAPRSALSTSVVNGKIYAFGGAARRGGAPESTLFQYDPAMDTWATEEDMPARMAGMSTNVVGGRIYIIGGTSASYPYSMRLSTVWEYDIGLRPPSPDFNGDGVVDDADATIMVNHWHTNEPLCDIAPEPWGDGIVDVQDMAALIEHLGPYSDDPSLVAHWALDEAEGNVALDSVSENGESDGVVFGKPFWLPNGGKVDGAVVLDGVDDYIFTDTVMNPANGPFSILAWIDGGAPGQVVISEPGGSNWLSTDPVDGHLMTELASLFGRSSGPLLSDTVITDVNWHRIGLLWDGLHRMLYVDGVMVAQDTQDSLNIMGTGMYIGTGKAMAPGIYFSGLIDDVRIYNRAVSP